MTWRPIGGALILLASLPAGARRAQTPAADLALVPYPRQLTRAQGELHLGTGVVISVPAGGADDRFAAGTLVAELRDIDHIHATVASGGGTVVLLRSDSSAGRARMRAASIALPADAGPEAYALLVSAHQAAVIGNGAAGVFYGVQTLRQLIHPDPAGGAFAPAVTVADWPALAWRGVQIDMSRGPMPTLAAMERDVALLAEFKVNMLVLYFENTFAYKSQPVMSARNGAMTASEAAALVAFAHDYHVTVTPEQESFGHLHLALQEEEYEDLAEVPYGSVLSPAAPGSLDLIGQMFAELDRVFPGPFFHIGGDETSELGQGRSQTMFAAEASGAAPASVSGTTASTLTSAQLGQLYIDYLKQIAERLAPYHRKILFWGDIAQGHAELLRELPSSMIAVAWVYSPEPSYDRSIEPFRNAGMETWVAPGVSNWSRIYPDYADAIPNIQVFVADGRRLGATGLINTTWMDDGESLFDYCWYGLGFGAAAGWEDQPDPARYDAAYDWALYRADGHAFAGEVASFTAINKTLQAAIGTDGADRLVWLDPFSVSGQATYTRMEPAAHQVRLLAEGVIADLAAHRDQARRNADLLEPVDFAARRFDFLGEKAIYAHMIVTDYEKAQVPAGDRRAVTRTLGEINGTDGWLQDMRDGITNLRDQYQALWLAGNQPYFLGNILVRYDQELTMWQQEARLFDAIAANYRVTGTLPALVHPDLAAAEVNGPEGRVPKPEFPRIIH